MGEQAVNHDTLECLRGGHPSPKTTNNIYINLLYPWLYQANWSSSPNEGLITRINPEDQSVISAIDLGTDPYAIAAGE